MSTIDEIIGQLANKPDGEYKVMKLWPGVGAAPIGTINSLRVRDGRADPRGYNRTDACWVLISEQAVSLPRYEVDTITH